MHIFGRGFTHSVIFPGHIATRRCYRCVFEAAGHAEHDPAFGRQREMTPTHLTNRSSQPLAVLMSSFHMISTLKSAAKLGLASGG